MLEKNLLRILNNHNIILVFAIIALCDSICDGILGQIISASC